jgi:hypothetical protein
MEKDEMNYTLRQHSLGQNKGRYDYLFNFIKRLTLPKSQQVRPRPASYMHRIQPMCLGPAFPLAANARAALSPSSLLSCLRRQVVLLRKAVESGDKGLAESYRQFVLPDNQHTPMGTSFLEAYSNHTSQINLKRGFDSVRPTASNLHRYKCPRLRFRDGLCDV